MNRKFIAALATFGILLSAEFASAQNFTLRVEGPTQVGEGNNFDATVFMDFDGPDPTSGWSYGICNDPAFVTFVSEVDGVVPMTAGENGDPVDFNTKNSFPEGYNVGLVICITGCATLPPGTNYELTIGTYTGAVETPTTSTITPCDTVGVPPVATVIVINGQSVIPTQIGLDVAVVGVPDPAFTYSVNSPTVGYSPSDGAANFTVDVTLDQDDNGAPLVTTQGFSMGMSHDPALASVVSVTAVGELATINDGDGPDFFEVGLADTNGWTVGVVNAITGGVEFAFEDDLLIEVAYSTVASALIGNDTVGASMDLTFTDTVGTPPVVNVVVVNGGSVNASFGNGTVTFSPVSTVQFRRGDSNDDGIVNIADGIWILNALFQGGPTMDCDAAADANADGGLDASDAAYVFQWRFLGGPPPPAPFPDCGTFPGQLPAPDDCNSYNGC